MSCWLYIYMSCLCVLCFEILLCSGLSVLVSCCVWVNAFCYKIINIQNKGNQLSTLPFTHTHTHTYFKAMKFGREWELKLASKLPLMVLEWWPSWRWLVVVEDAGGCLNGEWKKNYGCYVLEVSVLATLWGSR